MKVKANIFGITSAAMISLSIISPLSVFATAQTDTVANMIAEAEKATSETQVTFNIGDSKYTTVSHGRFECNADGTGNPEVILDAKDIHKLAIMTNQISGAISRTQTLADQCQAKADSIDALIKQFNGSATQKMTVVDK